MVEVVVSFLDLEVVQIAWCGRAPCFELHRQYPANSVMRPVRSIRKAFIPDIREDGELSHVVTPSCRAECI
jgi:hypothetical protein